MGLLELGLSIVNVRNGERQVQRSVIVSSIQSLDRVREQIERGRSNVSNRQSIRLEENEKLEIR